MNNQASDSGIGRLLLRLTLSVTVVAIFVIISSNMITAERCQTRAKTEAEVLVRMAGSGLDVIGYAHREEGMILHVSWKRYREDEWSELCFTPDHPDFPTLAKLPLDKQPRLWFSYVWQPVCRSSSHPESYLRLKGYSTLWCTSPSGYRTACAVNVKYDSGGSNMFPYQIYAEQPHQANWSACDSEVVSLDHSGQVIVYATARGTVGMVHDSLDRNDILGHFENAIRAVANKQSNNIIFVAQKGSDKVVVLDARPYALEESKRAVISPGIGVIEDIDCSDTVLYMRGANGSRQLPLAQFTRL